MAVLLGVVFQFLISQAKIDQSMQKVQSELLIRSKLQTRLNLVFTTAKRLVADGKQIEVLFDAGIDPDPVFSGEQAGVLFCDEENQLCFKQRPMRGEEERTEVLSAGREVQWEFLNTKSGWVNQWPKNQEPPSIIRLKLGTVHFTFIRPDQKPLVLS